jgi:hypothetical protein
MKNTRTLEETLLPCLGFPPLVQAVCNRPAVLHLFILNLAGPKDSQLDLFTKRL